MLKGKRKSNDLLFLNYYSKLELNELVQLKEIIQKLNHIVLEEGLIDE